ncbi:hypothetical protein B0T24DRAFT_575425 [Lasiosphaeria ovina]|uniref:FAD-binding domain-containing protein n=1 Tax=Lasiosphaeria ovina TaxID=92902 RepID=A0AAE0KB06_9PEZI|nr:hypothetical protein B0T24DRAFT_575425 [Lasiosphaeria ovina]
MHVLIVGAGLGGLSLAQILRKQGISFEIFERDTDADARFQGWAIALYSIVDALVDSYPADLPDLRASVNHLAPLNLPAQITLWPPGREERVGFQDSPDQPLIRAERSRLRRWLSANIPIQWGKRVTRIENSDDGVSVQFEDGGSAHGDILVGADGINSIVRQHLLNRPSSDLLKVIPLATVIGQLDLSGEALKRQLALGHSGYMCIRPDLGFVTFTGLHYVAADGESARFYWNLMQFDGDIAREDHWLRAATGEQKLAHALQTTRGLPAKQREIFELTAPGQIKHETHVWRDVQLDAESLPPGRVVLMGDAAHAMMPFRGEGGYHTLVDSLVLGKALSALAAGDRFKDVAAVRQAVAEYNVVMLRRAGQAVRDSRNLDMNAQRFGPDGLPLDPAKVPPIVPLPDVEIVLGVGA